MRIGSFFFLWLTNDFTNDVTNDYSELLWGLQTGWKQHNELLEMRIDDIRLSIDYICILNITRHQVV